MDEKLLVNGKAITMAEYFELMKKAKEAVLAYKQSPAYESELKERAEAKILKDKFYAEFIALGKRLKLSSKVLGSIGYKLYLESKEQED
jgi:hypothetical protein